MAALEIGFPFRAVDRWEEHHDREDSYCYFCRPGAYEPMWPGCEMCARCGQIMWANRKNRLDYPLNPRMMACLDCEEEMVHGEG